MSDTKKETCLFGTLEDIEILADAVLEAIRKGGNGFLYDATYLRLVLLEQCVERVKQNIHEAYSWSSMYLRERSRELKQMSYADYLLTPEWIHTRDKARERADNKCQLCNKGGELHVHHKTYERKGHELDDDLIVLCKKCHAKFHDKEVADTAKVA